MGILDQKITAENVAGYGLAAAPDVLTGTAAENKALFDRLVREIVRERFNAVVDALAGTAGAGEIGAAAPAGLTGATVQALLNSLKDYADGLVLKAGSVTSVFGRAGAVAARAGDYTASDVGAAEAPAAAAALPASGAALAANTVYTIPNTAPVGTYQFAPPPGGWAHGTFYTDAAVTVTFAGGTFLGAAPSFNASSRYEFDVSDGVWAFAEVVGA